MANDKIGIGAKNQTTLVELIRIFLVVLLVFSVSFKAAMGEVDSLQSLRDAIRNGWMEKIADFVEQGGDINANIHNGARALHFAVLSGRVETIEFLIQHGADIHAVDNKYETALDYLVSGYPEMLKILIKHDDTTDHTLESASIIRRLYNRFFGKKITTIKLQLMIQAIWKSPFEESNKIEMINMVIGVSPYGSYKEFIMRQNNAVAIAELLIKHGADIKHNNNEVFHNAAKRGHFAIVELLIKHGADIHARNSVGSTALHYAVQGGYFAIVELLIKHGADINAEDGLGRTALHRAAEAGHFAIVEMLIKHGADIHAQEDANGSTALHSAISWNGYPDIVEMLMNHDSSLIHVKNEWGRTALYYAVHYENYAIAEILIKHGADIHAEDNSGMTVFNYATRNKRSKIAKLIKDADNSGKCRGFFSNSKKAK